MRDHTERIPIRDGAGHRMSCSCGWLSPWRRTHADAMADYLAHLPDVGDAELAEALIAETRSLLGQDSGSSGPGEERHGPSGDRGGHATDKETRPPYAATRM